VTVVLKSGGLNHLKPSGHVQACNGIALHFTTHFLSSEIVSIAIKMGAIKIYPFVRYFSLLLVDFILDIIWKLISEKLTCSFSLMNIGLFSFLARY
jgi:hypothetical protein